MIKWLGHATQTTASVVVRDTSNGAATLVCNGVTYTQTVDTSVKDGLVRFDVTGLSAGNLYPYTLTIPSGETATSTLKTQSAGISRIGWTSCSSISGDGAMYASGNYDLDAMVCVGDEGYYESTATVNLAAATNVDTYNAANLETRSSGSMQYIGERTPFYIVHDDHEYGLNDMRWHLTAMQLPMPFLTDLDDLRDVVDAGAESTEHYSIGNPGNTDAGIDTGAFYHRFYVGNHTEVFVLAAVCWGRDPTDSTRLVRPAYGASNSMLGTKQVDWLKAALKASTKTFKIIMCPKMTLTAEFSNPDGFNAYFEEIDLDLAPYIHAGTDWAVPGGVIWCTGDYHTPSVHASEAGVGAATYDHVEVCACPAQKDSRGVRDSGVGGTYTVQWVNTGKGDSAGPVAGTPNPRRELRNFGVIEVQADGSYLEAKIVTLSGNEWWKGRVYAGENKLTYPDQSQGSV